MSIPVYEIFEKMMKDMPTERFSAEMDQGYKRIYYNQMVKLKRKG